MPTTSRSPDTTAQRWVWLLVALGSHTSWGAYPVLARYLQTISGLPGLSLLAVANGLVLLCMVRYLWQQRASRFWRRPLLWWLGLVVVCRGSSNVLAANYTLAIYVQLVSLSTPFLVVLLGRTFFREPIPRYTGLAIGLSLLGTLLIIGGSPQGVGLLHLALTRSDLLGIGLALFSSAFVALYMLLVRRSAQLALSGEAVLGVQTFSLMLGTSALSLALGEDWGTWALAGPLDWLIFALFVLGVMLGGNIGQIRALRHLGAPTVSSMFAWRFVSTLIMAALLLGEQITSLWQALGVLLVFCIVSWYVWQQSRQQAAA